ncbi:MAG: glycosyltransferase [Nitrospiraceae bacterium]|nr:MAG: glycosyltransferase [Nitrospiraceae bacterium]
MKILHVLETSIPDLAGYTIRAKYIVENQKKHGINPVVVTSPFFKGGGLQTGKENINGITYFRTNHIRRPEKDMNKVASYLTRVKMLNMYKKAVLEIVQSEKPDIIHAHSSYTNGLAANYASAKTRIPSIYELRSLWGESAVVDEGLKPDSLKYRMIWRLEMKAIQNASGVIAISEGIKREIVSRGIPGAKIDILPNGVDTGNFRPAEKDDELLARFGLEDHLVIGYIGSIRKLEGLKHLIKAFREINLREPMTVLFIVGEGTEKNNLEVMSKELGLTGKVIFTGRVPHDEILNYYSVIDVFVFPRINAKINQAVTPLKPLEAMSMGKVCIGSNVGGLMELITDGYNGLLFECENEDALVDKIMRLMKEPALYEKLKANGMKWVREEREWKVLTPRYEEIYEKLISNQ